MQTVFQNGDSFVQMWDTAYPRVNNAILEAWLSTNHPNSMRKQKPPRQVRRARRRAEVPQVRDPSLENNVTLTYPRETGSTSLKVVPQNTGAGIPVPELPRYQLKALLKMIDIARALECSACSPRRARKSSTRASGEMVGNESVRHTTSVGRERK